eukprot:119330_1
MAPKSFLEVRVLNSKSSKSQVSELKIFKIMSGVCSGNWYQSILYPNQTYASSVPAKIAMGCTSTTSISTTPAETNVIYPNGNEKLSPLYANLETEAQIIVRVTMILGLLFLLIVLCRSSSKMKLDWYRLIAIYVFVTIAVPVSIEFGPSGGGFNRIIGFGILIHNLGEHFILSHIWLGDAGAANKGRNKFAALYAILYVWGIMTLIAFLEPLWLLFLVLMIQGSFCDYALVGSLIYLSRVVDVTTTNCCGSKISYGAFGVAAAICHILTIQPLFFSMALPNLSNGGAITVIFLMPTFILYVVFASSDANKAPRMLKTKSFGELNYEENIDRNKLLRQLLNATKKVQQMEQYSNAPNQSVAGNEVIDELARMDDGTSNPNAFDKVIREGLVYSKLNKAHNGRRALKIVAGVAFTCCMINSLIVLFAPCYTPPKC